MTKQTENANLVQIKRRLEAKYQRLAKITTSTPRRKSCLHHAEKYARQAANLEKLAPQ